MIIHIIWELERIQILCLTSQYLQDWLGRLDSVMQGPQDVPDHSKLGTIYIFPYTTTDKNIDMVGNKVLTTQIVKSTCPETGIPPLAYCIFHFHHHQEREEQAGAQVKGWLVQLLREENVTEEVSACA